MLRNGAQEKQAIEQTKTVDDGKALCVSGAAKYDQRYLGDDEVVGWRKKKNSWRPE